MRFLCAGGARGYQGAAATVPSPEIFAQPYSTRQGLQKWGAGETAGCSGSTWALGADWRAGGHSGTKTAVSLQPWQPLPGRPVSFPRFLWCGVRLPWAGRKAVCRGDVSLSADALGCLHPSLKTCDGRPCPAPQDPGSVACGWTPALPAPCCDQASVPPVRQGSPKRLARWWGHGAPTVLCSECPVQGGGSLGGRGAGTGRVQFQSRSWQWEGGAQRAGQPPLLPTTSLVQQWGASIHWDSGGLAHCPPAVAWAGRAPL